MPNTINIVQPKAEDGTPVSFVTRTNSIFKSDGSPLGDSMDAYMNKVDELSQNLTAIRTKSYSGTTSANGNIIISDIADGNTVFPLTAPSNFNGAFCSFGTASNGNLTLHFTNAAGAIISNTSISGTLYYINLSDLTPFIKS